MIKTTLDIQMASYRVVQLPSLVLSDVFSGQMGYAIAITRPRDCWGVAQPAKSAQEDQASSLLLEALALGPVYIVPQLSGLAALPSLGMC